MKSPSLVVVSGGLPGQEHLLLGEVITIGRGWDNDIPFPAESGVSDPHARIRARIGLFWLEDLGSDGGTFLQPPGGERFRLKPGEPVLLLDGALIGLSDAVVLQARGLVASQDEAIRHVLAHLQAFVNLCQGIQARLQKLEEMIRQSPSEADLVRVVAEELTDLSRTVGRPPSVVLPPLEDLPDPNSPGRLQSINNLFVSSLQQCPASGEEKKPCPR